MKICHYMYSTQRRVAFVVSPPTTRSISYTRIILLSQVRNISSDHSAEADLNKQAKQLAATIQKEGRIIRETTKKLHLLMDDINKAKVDTLVHVFVLLF